jgi:hypothetical protein
MKKVFHIPSDEIPDSMRDIACDEPYRGRQQTAIHKWSVGIPVDHVPKHGALVVVNPWNPDKDQEDGENDGCRGSKNENLIRNLPNQW